jgi:hypothetical protein
MDDRRASRRHDSLTPASPATAATFIVSLINAGDLDRDNLPAIKAATVMAQELELLRLVARANRRRIPQ